MVDFIFLKIIKHMICPNLSHIYVDMAQIRAEHMFENFQKNYHEMVYIYYIFDSSRTFSTNQINRYTISNSSGSLLLVLTLI